MAFLVFLYNLFIAAFALSARVLALLQTKTRLFIEGRKGLLGKIKIAFADEKRKVIWFHCASLGEFEQGRPVMESIKKLHPEAAILLTFFSPSGYEVRKHFSGADYVFYLPLDTAKNAGQFIAIVKPQLAIFVKYEFWYHYLKTLHHKGIPTILISAIFQERHPFFKWYGGLHRKMLGYFDIIFVQNEASKKLLASIDITKTVIAGDTRIDRALTISESRKILENVAAFKQNQFLIVAGSTWKADEQLLKNALAKLPENIKLLIAPHEIDEAHLQEIKSLFGEASCFLNEIAKLPQARVCIMNTMGQLAYSYRYADYIWIGGGFNKTGIHNSLEGAAYDKPLVWGPEYSRYQEALDLIKSGAAVSVNTASALALQIQNWQQHPKAYHAAEVAAKQYIADQKGATGKIMNYIITKNVF